MCTNSGCNSQCCAGRVASPLATAWRCEPSLHEECFCFPCVGDSSCSSNIQQLCPMEVTQKFKCRITGGPKRSLNLGRDLNLNYLSFHDGETSKVNSCPLWSQSQCLLGLGFLTVCLFYQTKDLFLWVFGFGCVFFCLFRCCLGFFWGRGGSASIKKLNNRMNWTPSLYSLLRFH